MKMLVAVVLLLSVVARAQTYDVTCFVAAADNNNHSTHIPGKLEVKVDDKTNTATFTATYGSASFKSAKLEGPWNGEYRKVTHTSKWGAKSTTSEWTKTTPKGPDNFGVIQYKGKKGEGLTLASCESCAYRAQATFSPKDLNIACTAAK